MTIVSIPPPDLKELEFDAFSDQPAPGACGFMPTAETYREFRKALGCFGTGVTVVTAADGSAPVGITVNSFASVSLDPALVLWSIEKKSYRFGMFESACHYAIHVLDHSQTDCALQFAHKAGSFEHCEWHYNEYGVPVIEGVVALFECEQVSVHDGGDHKIIVGKVVRASNNGGDPLLFVNGEFGRFIRAA